MQRVPHTTVPPESGRHARPSTGTTAFDLAIVAHRAAAPQGRVEKGPVEPICAGCPA